MLKSDRTLRLAASITLALCLGSAEAAVFDAGQALKADMAQGAPANPYTDANGGVWTFGRTTAVAEGTVTTLDYPGYAWAADLKGFSKSAGDPLPTINVNVGAAAVAGNFGLTAGYLVAPGEIVLHPDRGDSGARFAIIRFIVPQTGFYHLLATFRDVQYSGGTSPGVDVHVVVNGADLANAVVSTDAPPPAGSVPSFTAEVRSLSLAAGDTVDFDVGPNGTEGVAHGCDGTGVRASITAQTPYQADIVNLDINGYGPEDTAPTNTTYSGAAAVGVAGDFWNSAIIKDACFETLTASRLKLADGLTSSTVRFSMRKPGGLLHGDCREPAASLNPLLDDYVYILPNDTPGTNSFTISGLVPNGAYDLYFYCHAGVDYNPGRFVVNGIAYDSVNTWFASGDYALCPGITADGNGVITGDFSMAAGVAGVLNGLQIVGTFPRPQAEVVNLDINGYNPPSEYTPGADDTYSGAAAVGAAGDYWNHADLAYNAFAGIAARSLKLPDGITNSTVSFSLRAIDGGLLTTDRVYLEGRSQNALIDDYADIIADTTNRFTISGLAPNASYDLYFYSRAGNLYRPGRFVINNVNYDTVNQAFPIGAGPNWIWDSRGGDYALCAGIAADGSGSIAGDICRMFPGADAVFNGLQIVGTIPRQVAELVNLDINGFFTGQDSPPVAGDTYAGAAAGGEAGDFWNGLTIGDATVAGITTPHLKLPDGATRSTVSFSLSRPGGGLLGADRVPDEPPHTLFDDYVYVYGETLRFTISGLVPNTAYDLYFYCQVGRGGYTPGRFVINGVDYYSFDQWFPGNTGGDHAVCAGISADGSGTITGDFLAASPPAAGVINGLQIMGAIPRLPQGTIFLMH